MKVNVANESQTQQWYLQILAIPGPDDEENLLALLEYIDSSDLCGILAWQPLIRWARRQRQAIDRQPAKPRGSDNDRVGLYKPTVLFGMAHKSSRFIHTLGSLIHSSASCSATAGVCWVLTSIFPPTQAKLHAWAEVKHVHPLFGIG